MIRKRLLFAMAIATALLMPYAGASDETSLSKEEITHFLLTAKVVHSKDTGKGVTHPQRLTLSDGTITHDASFQAVDEHKSSIEFASGGGELNFVDSYKYNIAAYRLAELLGIDDMMPVYVERSWGGNKGSLSWWLPVKMDDAERLRQNITPPDPDKWNNQMYRIRVFDQLVYDTDANLGNVLIGEDWKVWRVDFTRAFRLEKNLRRPADLVRCDRQLLERLRKLDAGQLAERTKGYLNKDEQKAVLARRDKIVALFDKLIGEKGESQVLY